MELVAELWKANIKAEFVPQEDPSLQEQYEYASDHDIKCLVFITEAGISQTDPVKVRHLDPKREKEVKREELVKSYSVYNSKILQFGADQHPATADQHSAFILCSGESVCASFRTARRLVARCNVAALVWTKGPKGSRWGLDQIKMAW